MAVFIDVMCSSCETTREDVWSSEEGKGCICGGTWERLWTFTKSVAPGTHPSERVVVYESEKEGKVQFPGRTDVQVPDRLRQRGYVRRELNVADLASFERKHGVASERRHFNNGNGF